MQKPPNHFYTLVAREFKNDSKDEGIWIQAFALAEGDEERADVLYIDLRAQDLWDQHKIKEEEEKKKADAKRASEIRRELEEQAAIEAEKERKEQAAIEAEQAIQEEKKAEIERKKKEHTLQDTNNEHLSQKKMSGGEKVFVAIVVSILIFLISGAS